MSGRPAMADVAAVARSVGVQDAPSIVSRIPPRAQIGFVRMAPGPQHVGGGRTIPSEESFVVFHHLTAIPRHEVRMRGRETAFNVLPALSCVIVNLLDEVTMPVTSPYEALYCHLPQAALDDYVDARGIARVTGLSCIPGTPDPVMSHLAGILLPAIGSPSLGGSLLVDEIAVAVCAHVVERYGGGGEAIRVRRSGLSRAMEAKAKELLIGTASETALTDIAAACGLSRGYFIRAFEASTGLTPHRWLQRHRVERAKGLLTGSAMPIAEIALVCGFADQSHLTRVFTARVGTGPGKFRKTLRR